MNPDLLGLVTRDMPPEPWAEGDNIPWDEPGFSQRMLREHLSQDHDLASRRVETIERQVAWIHDQVLAGVPTRILDLGCGPGLYTSRLAALGHTCVGIDFAPAPIRYATEQAAAAGTSCTYHHADVREADFGQGFGLVMMLFGQINVFREAQAMKILAKAYHALAPGGQLLLEPQRSGTVEATGTSGASWYSSKAGEGLFLDEAHVTLMESFWDAASRAATQRFLVVDAESGAVTAHAMTTQAYSEEQLASRLEQVGFSNVRFHPSLVGFKVDDVSQAANLAVVGRKGPA